MAAITVPRPLLAGRPVRGAALGVLVAASVSALPAQIDWADPLGSVTFVLSVQERVRLLTVSPTLLYSDRTGVAAYLWELLWFALFAGPLLLAARAVARRCGGTAAQPAALCLVLVNFAPLANLLALWLRELPALVTDPTTRGDRTIQLITDAQNGSFHAVLLAACGAAAALLSSALRTKAEGLDGKAAGLRETVPDPAPVAVAARKEFHTHLIDFLSEFLGPRDTLWRRVGAAVAAMCAAAALLLLASTHFTESLYAQLASPVCRVNGDVEGCARTIAYDMSGPLPRKTPGVLPSMYWGFARLYALQTFAATFVVTYFLCSRAMGPRRGPVPTLLATWAAYTWSVIGYVAILEVSGELGMGMNISAATVDDLVTDLFLPPTGLNHTLLAAPLVAGGLALFTRARTRSRTGPDKHPQPVTNGGGGARFTAPG